MAKEPIKTNHLGEEIIEYPKWIHDKDKGSVLVQNKKEEDALGKEKPADPKPAWGSQ